MLKKRLLSFILVSCLLLLAKGYAQENTHILKIYYYGEGTLDEKYAQTFAHIYTNNTSIIFSTIGSDPVYVLQAAQEIYFAYNVHDADGVLSITKKMHSETIYEKVIKYFRELTPYCYFAFNEPMTTQCKLKLKKKFPFSIVANFKYLYPGNYLFKIIKTLDNKVKIEKR